MASKQAIDRLKKEYKRIEKEPVEFIEAAPEENDILTWHYTIRGPPNSLYEGGIYWGKVMFPKQYPYKPPSIVMLTPNGRFKTNTRLCLSMSDFHPESWNPLWNVGSILSGVLSFMLETSPTYGSTDSTDEQKRIYAASSLEYNLKDKNFVTLFPHYKQLHAEMQKNQAIQRAIQAQKQQQQQSHSQSNSSSTNSNSAVDAQPLLNGNAVNANQQQQGQGQEAAQAHQQGLALAGQHNHLVDKIVIVIVMVAIGFMLSYLYI